MNELLIHEDTIKDKIFTIRGLQVMLDKDLAELYEVETKVFNQAVKRNENRFPVDFRFQLTNLEKNELVTNCDRFNNLKYSTSHPYAFTEQGVSMLSAVLRIKDKLEIDEKFDRVFNALEDKSLKPKQGIFYDGQVYDAYVFVSDLIRSSKHSIILIDNYCDDSVLILLSKRDREIKCSIYTKNISKQLLLDVTKHNSQYPNIKIKQFNSSPDRFLIIDEKDVYHMGASLKDLGKEWFAFSRFDIESFDILSRLDEVV